MKLVPFGSRVVVMPPPAAKSGIEGFELGAGSQDRPESGTVVAIGPEVKFIKVGDTVSFTRYDAVDITVEGEVLWIMKEENVAGKFEA